MKKFVCKVCGYIYEGEAAPAECPVCHAKSNMFEEVKGELKLAAEHEFGVYGSTVKNNPDISAEDKKYIFDQLMANFNGECSEVGMYLCMARIAHREGFPEVGLYWEKAAYEEAEHAAKFAEMLGSDLESNMHADTKKNLAWRVDCEFGATQGKFDLAKKAKQLNLDAIHDTVHEMAKDEARHSLRWPLSSTTKTATCACWCSAPRSLRTTGRPTKRTTSITPSRQIDCGMTFYTIRIYHAPAASPAERTSRN